MMRRSQNRQFLSQKNLAMTRLLSEIDTPDQQQLSSNPTPPLLMAPPQQPQTQMPDSLSNLIAKAHDAVRSSSLKSLKAVQPAKIPNSRMDGKNQQGEAFLTGVLLNEPQGEPGPEQARKEVLDEQLMKLLRKKSLDDELSQLRRQIKLTNGHLKSYERQVKDTQKSVYSLAGKYNAYFNINIPVKSSTVDFSGLSYFQLKNFKNCVRRQ